jgi:integrase
MSAADSSKRIVVWVQHRGDRPFLSLEWIDPQTNRRRSKSAETCNPTQAEIKRADLEADLNAGRYVEASGISWEAFRDLFEREYVAPLRKNTRENHKATLDLFERLCKPGRLRDVDARVVSRFAAAMRQEPGSTGAGMLPSSVKVRLNFLHAALRWAAKQDLIPKCPIFPVVKVPKRTPQPVPAEMVERLLAVADPTMRAFLLAGWYGGLRFEEALSLQWEAVPNAPYLDLLRRRIVFPAEFVKAVEDQWIPIDPMLQAALSAFVPDPADRQGRVFRFYSERRGKRFRTEEVKGPAVRERIADLARRAGVKLTMKSLRRGFGCRWAGKVPAQVLRKLMRHSTLEITVAYYANVDDAAEAAVFGQAAENRSRVTSRVKADNAGMNGSALPDANADSVSTTE